MSAAILTLSCMSRCRPPMMQVPTVLPVFTFPFSAEQDLRNRSGTADSMRQGMRSTPHLQLPDQALGCQHVSACGHRQRHADARLWLSARPQWQRSEALAAAESASALRKTLRASFVNF